MSGFHQFIQSVNLLLWGPPMLFLLMGTHVFFTFRLRFIQRYTFKAIKLSFTPDKKSQGDVSQFGALATALASTLGTGNIIGVSTAIALGGPGAIFWCWVTGVLGISTSYAECLLSIKYRKKMPDGTMLGGPMYTLEKGLGSKFLGKLFCIFTVLASFGIGCTVQAHAISSTLQSSFQISPIVTGIVVSISVGYVIIGGAKSIVKVCQFFVPFVTVFYIVGCVIILYMNRDFIIPSFALIIESAFTAKAAASGFAGSTIIVAAKIGITRGLFTNEAGLGSAPIAAALAKTRNPVRQALVSMTATFWDTVIICAMTGVVIVSTILKNPESAKGITDDALTHLAFSQISGFGAYALTFSILIFAYATIVGWSYYGDRAVTYLVGSKGIHVYHIVYLVVLFLGANTALQIVWDFSDMVNGLMAIPNLISILILHNVVRKDTKHYLWNNHLDDFGD